MSKRNKKKRLTEKDARSVPRAESEMRIDGELVPPQMLINFQLPGEIIPVTTHAGLLGLVQAGAHHDEFFKRLRESRYTKEMEYLKWVPEIGYQQGVKVILSLCAEVALKVSDEYPFLTDDAFRWLESKFKKQGVGGDFSARWEAYRVWAAQGNHIYFRWPSGTINIYWLGDSPKKSVSRLWGDTPALSPKQLDRDYCLFAGLLDSRLR